MPVEGTFIPINANASPQALELKTLQQLMEQVLDLNAKILGEMNNMLSSGSSANIEVMYGIPTGSPPGTNGTTVFNIVNGSSQAMLGSATNSQCVNLARQIG